MRAILLLFLAATLSATAQIPVTDVSVLAQALQEVILMTQQLEQAKLEIQRLGDPESILPKTATDLIQTLSKTGEGRTLDQIQAIATGANALAYEANGLYRAPGSVLRRADGSTVGRALHVYRKFDAVTQARATLETVLGDTEVRRQEIRRQLRRTLNRLSTASTMAEVEKLQGVLTAQNSELSAVDRERDAAASRVVVQQIENQTDTERQEAARREEHLVAFRQAQERLNRMLTPERSLVRIPNPNRP
ncbi:MAG: hypothetical protein AB7O66_14660 [Limisphaerales bacterium]